jgi:hypothetical protein
MALEWLNTFYRNAEKPADYAAKTLAAYRLGIKAKGSILGVTIERGQDCCAAAQALSPSAVYRPDEAPLLPLPTCSRGRQCTCIYRPLMSYQKVRSSTT